VSDDRPTVDLPVFVPTPPNTRYSVKRAHTENARSASRLVERVAVAIPRALRPAMATEPRWRVEVGDERVILRGDSVQIELSIDEARRLAETILRGK
jgi:hypothetical protein